MKHYSLERKEAAIQKMMPPSNTPISKLVLDTGITEATLYNWRKQAKHRGLAVPGGGKNAENWSSSDKFAVVLETATLNESELAEYCRKKGLFAEQILMWKHAYMGANATTAEQEKTLKEQTKKIRNASKGLKPIFAERRKH